MASSNASGVIWGYARVSTAAQDPAPQIEALRQRGVPDERIFVDVASAAVSSHRPAQEELLTLVNTGDTVMTWKLDRWGRGMIWLIESLDQLTAQNIGFISITDGIDMSTSAGRLQRAVIAALAEYEREVIRERTAAAMAAKRARGEPLGRVTKLTPEQIAMIHTLRDQGQTQPTIARTVGLSQSTVSRVLRGAVVTAPLADAVDMGLFATKPPRKTTKKRKAKP